MPHSHQTTRSLQLPPSRQLQIIPQGDPRKLLTLVCTILSLLPGCSPSPDQLASARAQLRKTIGIPEGPILSPHNSTPSATASNITPVNPSIIDQTSQAIEPTSTRWIDLNSLPQLHWEIIYLGNRPVGYTRRSAEFAKSELLSAQALARHSKENPLLLIEAESRIRIKNKGAAPTDQSVVISTLESPQGELIELLGKLELGNSKRRFQGLTTENVLSIDQITYDPQDKPIVNTSSVPWNPEQFGPFALQQSLQRLPMQPKDIRTIRYLDPFRMAVSESRLEAIDIVETINHSGKLIRLLEIQNRTITQGREANSTLWVDNQGVIQKSYNPAQDLLAFACDPQTARFVLSKDEFDAITIKPVPLLGSLPKRPSESSMLLRISSDTLPLTDLFPSKSNQRTNRSSPKNLSVEIFSIPPFDATPTNLTNTDPLAEDPISPDSIEPSESIRWDTSNFQQWTKTQLAALPENASITNRAEQAWKALSQNIQQIPLDKTIQNPSDTLRNQRGDCIDQALCLTAALRSLGVHARIAVGLRAEPSTVRPTLAFHTWTEYHDGTHWIPVDSTDENFVLPPDHLKVSDSNFNSINIYEPLLTTIRLLGQIEATVRLTKPDSKSP